jgi:hypothetical protein
MLLFILIMLKPEITIPDLTSEQEEAVAERYLSNLSPGRYNFPIFAQMARLNVGDTVEIGMIKPPSDIRDSSKILLTQRSAEDVFWPNQWHIPGSVILVTDEEKHEQDFSNPIERVLKEVGGDISFKHKPIQTRSVLRSGLRGKELTARFIVQVEGDPDHGEFFDTTDVLKHPPQGGLLESHDVAIESMDKFYRALRSHSLNDWLAAVNMA